MNIFFKLLLLIAVFFQVVFAEIITTDSIETIEKILENSDEKTLVILDCDDVLIRKTDAVFDPKNEKFLTKLIGKILMKNPLIALRLGELRGIVLESIDQILVDEKMPDLVSFLQRKGVKVIVLTAMKNEILNDKWAIDIRINELNKFGFDFSKSWKNLAPKFFGKEGNSQYYESGILCSKPGAKGNAIRLFQDYAKCKPSQIVFIDDRRKNLENMEETMKDSRIKLTCIEYTAVQKIPYKFDFSEARAIFQLNYLISNNAWLSDEAAEKEMVK